MPIAIALTLGLVLAPSSQGAETWDELAAEYEDAFMSWAQEMSRTGDWSKPESERTPGPWPQFWPRFEAQAEGGDGRAVLWLLQNAYGEGEERSARLRQGFERVRKAGDAEWVASALLVLAAEQTALGSGELAAYFDDMARPEHAALLRPTALLVRAALAHETEAELEDDLLLRAALLRWRGVELAPGEDLPPEDATEIAVDVLADLEKDHRLWSESCMRLGDDGVYYSTAAFTPDPRASWRPVVEDLAERGATKARAWVLFNTWPRNEAEKARARTHLDALAKEKLDPKTLQELRWRVDSLVQNLGVDFVEPRVRTLCEQAPEEVRRGLLLGLGDGLCETAPDDAQRQRGIALLREVGERWPGTDDAKRAMGKLFRHENLVVGKRVPDFETVDADGNAFKLSDYAGKVTVIDFWGFW